MKSRLIVGAVLTVVLVAGSGLAEEPLKSGPPVGAKNNRNGFFPNFVAGPGTGERRCPV
jgi:hypothetical protein